MSLAVIALAASNNSATFVFWKRDCSCVVEHMLSCRRSWLLSLAALPVKWLFDNMAGLKMIFAWDLAELLLVKAARIGHVIHLIRDGHSIQLTSWQHIICDSFQLESWVSLRQTQLADQGQWLRKVSLTWVTTGFSVCAHNSVCARTCACRLNCDNCPLLLTSWFKLDNWWFNLQLRCCNSSTSLQSTNSVSGNCIYS